MPSLWKQDGKLHPAFERFHRCLDDDWFLVPYELRLQHASAAALLDAGILDADEHQALSQALDALRGELADQATAPDSDAEDLHTFVEAELTARAGTAGRKIHTGRSRNDQVATLIQLFLLDRAGQAADALAGLVARLAEQAIAWAPLEMPFQTHAQFAAPGSVGAWALSHAAAFERDRRALIAAIADWRAECALGAGAVAGSSIPLDRQLLAERLGFDGPSLSALDPTGRRDESMRFLAWATTFALHVQGFAADVLQFMQTPFRWLKPLDGLMTGSSMMPNKSNPDGLELLRGEANALYGAFVQTLTTLKGLTSGYNRDLQCLKPVLRDAMQSVDGLIELVEQHVVRMEFDADRLTAARHEGNIGATLAMEQAVLDGKPLRDAHHAEADRVTAARTEDISGAAGTDAPAGGQADSPAAESTGASGDGTDVQPASATRYRTSGAASPDETVRLAKALLDRVAAPVPS